MNHSRMFAIIAAAIFAAGCSSGGSAPEPRVETPATAGGSPEQPGPTADYIGGYLFGTLYIDDAANTELPIQLLLSEDGRFRATQLFPYSWPQSYLLLRGTFRLDGPLIAGEGIGIANPGETWADGETVTDITISGTLENPDTINNGRLMLSVNMASGDSARIEARYEVATGFYWRPSSLEALQGRWSAEQADTGSWYPDPYRNADPPLPSAGYVTITVGQDGAFEGRGDDGCAMTGQFSLIDTRYQLWSVDYTISGCERAGEYSGLVLGDNGWYAHHSLFFSADDGTRSQALEFWQQVD